MAKIKKREFVERIAEKNNISIYKANLIVDSVFDEVQSIVESGDSIGFNGIGVFGSYIRNALRLRSISTGEIVEYPARRLPKFKVSSAWKAVFPQF